MGQHFRKSHAEHPHVKRILIVKDQKLRRQMCDNIVGKGREKHNEDEQGIYAVKYKKKGEDYSFGMLQRKFETCPVCHQMLRGRKRHT